MILDPPTLARLSATAEERGLLRLGVARIDHPGFAPARERLRDFLAAGKAGEMEYLARGAKARQDPTRLLEGARSILVAAVPYRGVSGPIARYAQSADYHTEIHRRLEALGRDVQALVPGVQTRVCVDTKPLLERSAAVLAGLGFIGKHGGLIIPGLGSHLLLGALLCTADWTGPDLAHPRVADRLAGRGELWDACGACTACLDQCPTAAFDGPGDLDPRRCISYLTLEHRGRIADELAERMGGWIAGCDECQDVCPYNQIDSSDGRVPSAAWLAPAPGRPREPVAATLAMLGNNQHRGFVRHTALNRVPRRALRRNALIALGNAPGALDDEQRCALERAMDDADPELARLARWSASRRGLGPR